MIPYIESYENPQVGDFFMVRTVDFMRNEYMFTWPVVDKPHRDGKHGLDTPHYHIDWRFMPEEEVKIQRDYNQKHKGWETLNAEYFVPITKKEFQCERYDIWKYNRDHNFPVNSFKSLERAMEGVKMTGMRCPHHGTNLLSCKPVDGVVTCPQHGLRWNVKTGELVL